MTSIEQPTPDVAAGIRKIVYYQEEILVENGTMPPVPALRATAAAVITNPWNGTGPDTDLGPEAQRVAPHIAKALTVRAHKFSGKAAEKIAAAGGTAEVLA